ncbi:MAG TPA: MFS transporter [Tepidisphaeraceae bacterium]|jgi:EmrB/QacA subfamily drug resistance transporter
MPETDPSPPRSKFWILLITSLVSSLIMLDSNIVAVALPAIGRSFRASFEQIEWIVTAYLLSYAALLLAAGAYADLRGRRKAMLLGLIIFAASSAGCGLAPSTLVLNIARAVQGVGGSLLLTAALAIITNTFIGVERARAFAVWGACLGVALTAGPIVGGAITNWFGWRWVFLVNVPACIILMIATIVVIKESRDPDSRRLDILGIVTFSPGLFLLVWGLIEGNDAGWTSAAIVLRLAGALLFFGLFIVAERRQLRPMVDLSLFARSTFLGSVFAMLGYGAAAQVMVFYLPLFLQNAYGFHPAQAGLAMLPFAIPMVLAPRVTSKLATRISGRDLLAVGLAITCAGNLLFWLLSRPNVPYVLFVGSMLTTGAGAGILNGETVKVLGGAVPPERAGMASGLASTTRFIGILVGVAGLGAVLSHLARHAFVQAAISLGLTADQAMAISRHVVSGDLNDAISNSNGMTQHQLLAAGRAAFADGFSAAGLLAAFTAGVACALTLRFVRQVDTAPIGLPREVHCKTIDCRNPI